MSGEARKGPGRPKKDEKSYEPPADGRHILIRKLSPGTFQRLHVVKAKMGCPTWNDFVGKALETFERNLGR